MVSSSIKLLKAIGNSDLKRSYLLYMICKIFPLKNQIIRECKFSPKTTGSWVKNFLRIMDNKMFNIYRIFFFQVFFLFYRKPSF